MSFIDTVTPIIMDWAKDIIIEDIVHIGILLFLIVKVIPWFWDLWYRINGQ